MYWASVKTLEIKRGTRQRPLMSGTHISLMKKEGVFRTSTAAHWMMTIISECVLSISQALFALSDHVESSQ